MTEDVPQKPNDFENFKGFILTLFGQKQFVAMFKKEDKATILNFIVEHKYFTAEKTKELIQLYTDTDYSAFLSTIARGEIIKTIASKSDELLKGIANASPEEIAFNKMLYNLNFFDDKRLSAVKDALNKYDN